MYELQELRCKEDELKQKQVQQRQLEEILEKRAQELDAREMDLLSRELKVMITQSTPTPNKRRGKFSKTRLKVNMETFRKKKKFHCFLFHKVNFNALSISSFQTVSKTRTWTNFISVRF